MRPINIFIYGMAALLGLLYGALFLGGLESSIRYLLDPDWRFFVTAPLMVIGALGSRNTFHFIRDEIREASLHKSRQV